MDFRVDLSFVPLIVLVGALAIVSQELSESPDRALQAVQIQLAFLAIVCGLYRRKIADVCKVFQLNRTGQRQLNCGSHGAAEKSFTKALEIGKNHEFIKFSSWQTFNNLGLLNERRGHYSRAQQYYTDALRTGRPACLTVFLYLTLPLALLIGFVEEFMRYGHRHTREKSLAAVSITILFIIFGFIGPFPTSMALIFSTTFAVFKGLRARTINRINSLMTQLKIAELDVSLGQFDRAAQAFAQLLEAPAAGKTTFMQAIGLTQLGRIHLQKEEFPEALDQLEQAKAVHEQQLFSQISPCFEYGETLLTMGEVYGALGQIEQAKQQYDLALQVAQKIKSAELGSRVLFHLGQLEFLGDPHRALSLVENAIAKIRETGYPALLAKMLHFKGFVLIHLEQASKVQLALSELALFEAIDLLKALLDSALEDADKVALFELQTVTYNLLQQVLIWQGKTEAALVIAEQGRARAFLDLLYQRLYPNDALIWENQL
ncbi:hypothetical protein C7293_04125 [filamentous cyanobacterium CCT1]|nr:hypothetical protein C7293_04125 [filamentous cyanobacterium CCT1]PSN80212.1 hypothetical protein C8B47_07640 [filamentous cyanobacterium CCP4]